MFVLELSKPSGICLAAFVEGALVGLPRLLALRHGLARHERRRRPGPAPRRASPRRCSTRLFERVDDPDAQLHARGPALQRRRRWSSTTASASAPPACAGATTRTTARTRSIMWRTPATLRGSLDDVPNASPRVTILALETSLRRHLRGRGDRGGRGAGQRRLLAGRPRPLRRRRAGDRLAPPPRAGQRRGRRRARPRRRRRSTTSTRVAVTQGPGLVGALLVGVATAKGLAAARRLPLAPVDHLQGHVAANFLAPAPMEPPFLCLIASGGHTLLARVTRPPRLRGARAHARRRGGRGVRQGRAAARAGLSGRPGAVAARRATATRPPSPSRPRRACPGSTSPSPGSRRRCSTRCASSGRRRRRAAPPTSPRATSTRSSRR